MLACLVVGYRIYLYVANYVIYWFDHLRQVGPSVEFQSSVNLRVSLGW